MFLIRAPAPVCDGMTCGGVLRGTPPHPVPEEPGHLSLHRGADQLRAIGSCHGSIRDPFATANTDSLVPWYAPTVQRYLTKPLPGDET